MTVLAINKQCNFNSNHILKLQLQLEYGPMPNVMTTQVNIGGAFCDSSVIPFLVPCGKVWLTPTAEVPCSNAANVGERKTWS